MSDEKQLELTFRKVIGTGVIIAIDTNVGENHDTEPRVWFSRQGYDAWQNIELRYILSITTPVCVDEYGWCLERLKHSLEPQGFVISVVDHHDWN